MRWLGLLLAFAGVAVVIVGRGVAVATEATLAGDLLCLGGGIAWAATTLVIRGTALRDQLPPSIGPTAPAGPENPEPLG